MLYGICLFVGCLTSQQHASISGGRICSDNFTCCHTEIEVADPTFYLTQSQYTDTRPTSPSADPIMPGAWQGGHWSANCLVTGMTGPRKNPGSSGIRTRDLPLSRRTPYHWANEAVAVWKSTEVLTAGRFFYLIPSLSLLKVRIWASVDLPFLKSFWLFLSFESVWGLSLWRSILL